MFIIITTDIGSTIAVNVNQIVSVGESNFGKSMIEFSDGRSLKVGENFLQLVSRLNQGV
jgi:hypothetical protein